MTLLIYKTAIYQAHLLSWQKIDIQKILRTEYETLLTIEQIDLLINSSRSQISSYKTKLLTGEARIHRRLKYFAIKNNLNQKFTHELNFVDSILISQLISIIQSFYKISYETLASIHANEFSRSSEVSSIIPSLSVFKYKNENNHFMRVDNMQIEEKKFEEIKIGNYIYKVIYSKDSKLYLNESNRELIIPSPEVPLNFLYRCFQRKELVSDPVINSFLNEVISRI